MLRHTLSTIKSLDHWLYSAILRERYIVLLIEVIKQGYEAFTCLAMKTNYKAVSFLINGKEKLKPLICSIRLKIDRINLVIKGHL